MDCVPGGWEAGRDAEIHRAPKALMLAGLKWYQIILIGVLVALILLLTLLLFLFLQHQHQRKGRTLDAAVKDPQPEEGVELDPWQNRHDEVPQGVMYAQVNLSGSRISQGMATSASSLSGELVDMKDRKAEEDRQMDSQEAASDAPQDVTYAQLNHVSLRQETTAPLFPVRGSPR
ncbi:leukocyte immunoglobulin-like receptor subfamily B member 4 [Rhynchonycteris naso]